MNQKSTAKRLRHVPERIGIYRIMHPSLGRYYQQVALRRNGELFDKRFFEDDCGGEAQALRLAQAWRDRIIATHPAMTLANFCTIVRKNNTSGVPGVNREIKRHRNHGGAVVERIYWVAHVPMPGIGSRRHSFSVKAFGEDEAKRLAITARITGLKGLEGAIFRSEMQPQPISTAETMLMLEKELSRPLERRAERAQFQSLKAENHQARRQQAQAKLQKLREVQVASQCTPTNRTGEPYIERSSSSNGTNGNWRVSIERQGKKYRKIFSDSVYGSTATALIAAKTWRDEVFQRIPVSNKATVAVRVNSTNTSGFTGVHLVKSGPDKTPISWVAMRPKSKGQPIQYKRFSIAKYGAVEAFALAVQARLAFVAELGNTAHFQHQAARQVANIISRRNHAIKDTERCDSKKMN